MTLLDETTAWLAEVARFRAQVVVDVPGGQAVLHHDFPDAHDHNKLMVLEHCAAAAVAEAAETILGGAGRAHRLIEVLSEAVSDELAPGLTTRGYTRHDGLLMSWDRYGERPGSDDPQIVELALSERAELASAQWQDSEPHQSPDVLRQLGQRIVTIAPAATFLAVRLPDGSVAARADLFVRGGIAQVEEVMTQPAHRGQGLASLLVLAAVDRALVSGARHACLQADADDWPQHLYRRLGFTDLSRTSSFTR